MALDLTNIFKKPFCLTVYKTKRIAPDVGFHALCKAAESTKLYLIVLEGIESRKTNITRSNDEASASLAKHEVSIAILKQSSKIDSLDIYNKYNNPSAGQSAESAKSNQQLITNEALLIRWATIERQSNYRFKRTSMALDLTNIFKKPFCLTVYKTKRIAPDVGFHALCKAAESTKLYLIVLEGIESRKTNITRSNDEASASLAKHEVSIAILKQSSKIDSLDIYNKYNNPSAGQSGANSKW
ncbi:hypothetical protein DICVIV_12849 [Dictyocaulus viviparus]|uniref:Uncharacterized protein n=1 Tax=Dictyocaulus viviparus TaxID=29172 RepID=A0A0D8XBR6_DICVI|nr:hypothetical protein DICVIV_12849 [Dictyocaulus viviparus]